jgi:2,3-bisphosphoglycerate-independent phosphoglycerate mutase
MKNPYGSSFTAHTTNPVPCIILGYKNFTLRNGKLSDIAPTVLNLMGIEVPEEMSGNILIDKMD